jgi:hypothetical protein
MIPPKSLRCLNVLRLSLLVPATDQVDFIPYLSKVDPVSRSEVNAQFRHSRSDRRVIAQVSEFDTINPR